MKKSTPPLFEFSHLSVVRGKRTVLDNFSLSVAPGESVAILGPNGSGKSTFIKVITRELYPVQSPKSVCRIFGEAFWDVTELRKKLGIASTDVRPFQTREVTALDAVLSGFFSSVGLWPHHTPTASMRKKSKALLKVVGIAALENRSMAEMSSGETQRCLIARALVHDPIALVLDEPTNNLDIRSAQGLRKTLSQIARDGTSVILVTHHVEDILPEMTRVVMIKEGRLFLEGDKKKLLVSKNLSRLFGHPVQITSDGRRYRLSSRSL